MEITPEREYLIAMEFFDGGEEIGDVEIDGGVIDEGLQMIRRMWDVGLAHRDAGALRAAIRAAGFDAPDAATWAKLVDGLLVGGFGGSPRYSNAAYQRSESDLWLAIIGMMPALVLNRIRRGRFLDVLVTHAPPRGIHDRPDQAHQGFRALRWFLRVFRPRYHLHGHTHIYDQRTVTTTRYHDTTVINAYGAREVDLDARP